MKYCPSCNNTYNDENLNFCLEDGSPLNEIDTDDPPPTVMMDSARKTNPNYEPQYKEPEKSPFDEFSNSPFGAPNQQMEQRDFAYPQQNWSAQAAGDKTFPIVSLALGIAGFILSMCCYLGIPLGGAAMVVGFLALNKINANPEKFEGKGLAIAGMITGGVGFLVSILMLIIAAIAGTFG